MTKTKSTDWLRLAGAVVGARDGLRTASEAFVRAAAKVEDSAVRRELGDVLGAIVRETDRLRFALKSRPTARVRKAA